MSFSNENDKHRSFELGNCFLSNSDGTKVNTITEGTVTCDGCMDIKFEIPKKRLASIKRIHMSSQ